MEWVSSREHNREVLGNYLSGCQVKRSIKKPLDGSIEVANLMCQMLIFVSTLLKSTYDMSRFVFNPLICKNDQNCELTPIPHGRPVLLFGIYIRNGFARV